MATPSEPRLHSFAMVDDVPCAMLFDCVAEFPGLLKTSSVKLELSAARDAFLDILGFLQPTHVVITKTFVLYTRFSELVVSHPLCTRVSPIKVFSARQAALVSVKSSSQVKCFNHPMQRGRVWIKGSPPPAKPAGMIRGKCVFGL